MTPIRCIIVDDEPLARRGIAARLEQVSPEYGVYHVVGEAGDGQEALALLESGSVELAFLDIQMPGMDGFGLLDRVGAAFMPVVVFVTAYDVHALAAFDAGALDYVLKPIDQVRFERALHSAKAQVLACRTAASQGALPLRTRFLVRERGRLRVVMARDVTWMEAAGDYVALHVGSTSVLVRTTMSALEVELDPDMFVRIHRSAMVQLGAIRELIPLENGRYDVILQGNQRCTLSASYRDRLARHLGDRL